jgi:hypothetical protein
LTSGWILLGSVAKSSLGFRGTRMWIDRAQPIVRLPVQTDDHGYAEVVLPLIGTPSGSQFGVQSLLRTTPTCVGQGTWCTSDALEITVH